MVQFARDIITWLNPGWPNLSHFENEVAPLLSAFLCRTGWAASDVIVFRNRQLLGNTLHSKTSQQNCFNLLAVVESH
jgi:hypothetical protein